MKKFFILTIFCGLLFLTGCQNNISDIAVMTLNKKAAEYMQAGEYEKAVARLESVLDLNSDYPETYYNLGVAYYQLNDYEKAVKALDTAITKKDKFADAFYSRAVVYEDWAYSLIEGEDGEENDEPKNVSEEDKAKSLTYLEMAKSDFDKYIELNPKAKDIDDVQEKLLQIENDLSNGEIKKD